MLVLVVYFLLPQFSNLPGIVDQVEGGELDLVRAGDASPRS